MLVGEGAARVDQGHTYAEFDRTPWTLLEAACSDDETLRASALDELVNHYWPAVYAHLRHSGRSRDEAAERTQAFFTDRILDREFLRRADRDRGRLRAWILTALKHYAIDEHRREEARGKGITISIDALEREESLLQTSQDKSPEQLYERRWAIAVFDAALERCEKHCTNNNLGRHWKAFHAQVIVPANAGSQPPTLTELAEQFDFPTPAHVASATKVVRKNIKIFMRQVIAEQVTDPDEREDEFRRVVDLLD